MYLFLVERAHVIRGPRARQGRFHDPIWISGIVAITVGFGSIICDAFMYPLYKLQNEACHIGLPPKVSIPLLTYDIFINVALTGVFIYYLRPLLNFRVNMRQDRQESAESLSLPVGPARHISRTVQITSTIEKRNSCSTDDQKVPPPTILSLIHI